MDVDDIMEGYGRHLVDDPIAGQETHVTDVETGTEISIPDTIDVGDVLVADGIAAETVVRTTDICSGLLSKDDSGDSGCGLEDSEVGSRFVDHEGDVSSLGVLECDALQIDPLNPPSFITTSWPSLELIKINKPEITEVLKSGEPVVAFTPDIVNVTSNAPSFHEGSIRESTKREQDRLKKKQLRENPAYRQKEKEKARVRMKLRRLDPVYRRNERQRDRQRRKAARLRTVYNKAKEIERQNQQNDADSIESTSGLLPLTDFEDYAVVETVPEQSQLMESEVLQYDGT